MPLLELSALTSPQTPGHVLGAIAAALPSNDPVTRGYLLAHPNTPARVVEDISTQEVGSSLHAILRAEPATPATRDRLLRAVPDEQLVEHIRAQPEDDSLLLAELTRRAQTAAAGQVALTATQLPGVDDDTRIHAIRTLLASTWLHTADSAAVGQLVHAAIRYPQHLRAFAARAQDLAHNAPPPSPVREASRPSRPGASPCPRP